MFNSYLNSTALNSHPTVALPIDNDRPRKQPPAATPLSFPNYIPQSLSSVEHEGPINLQQLFATVVRLSALTPFHLTALNLDFSLDVGLDEIVPERFIPPAEFENEQGQDVNARNPHSEASNIDTPATVLKAYRERLTELHHDKEDVYTVLRRRNPNPERVSIKVVHYRKFYSQLTLVGEYWDTSLDHLSPPPPQGSSEHPTGHAAMDIDELRSRAQAISSDSGSQTIEQTQSRDVSSTTSNPPLTYTGYRNFAGAFMPPHLRPILIVDFLTPILWLFRAHFESVRSPASLSIQKCRMPVDLTGLVYGTPLNRPGKDEPVLEGPLLAVQCRNVTDFTSERVQVVDLLREVGAILLLAQLRAREGREEVLPTEDEWYVKNPRFGGWSGDAIGASIAGSDTESGDEEGSTGDGEEEPPAKRRGARARAKAAKDGKHARWRQALEKSWEPPQKQWDGRVRYMKLGKEEGEWDDVSASSSFDCFTAPIVILFNHLLCIHVF